MTRSQDEDTEDLLHDMLGIDRPPGYLLRFDPEEIGGFIAQKTVRLFSDPANLAQFSGGVILPVMIARGRPVPFIPFMILSLIGQAAGRMAWQSYKNLETIAQAASRPDA